MNANQTRATVGRLAPSPTGGLHLGNARTFLLAWLLARKANGRMIFRMEDLDVTRARPEAAALALEDLHWLGLTWDEGPDCGGPHGPYVQSERTAVYQASLDRLIATNHVYPCTCTRADVQRAASAPHAEDEPPAYPGTCAHRHASHWAELQNENRPFAWRFRAAGQEVDWFDHVLGPQRHQLDRIGGDFIVARSGGVFGYQLAVVVDDAAMGVTQVVRGHDLVDSTPRQALVQQALGLPRPDYWHVGLVLGPDGKRLAKRDQSVKISEIRASGMSAMHLVRRLAVSLGWSDEQVNRVRSLEGLLETDPPESNASFGSDWTWS